MKIQAYCKVVSVNQRESILTAQQQDLSTGSQQDFIQLSVVSIMNELSEPTLDAYQQSGMKTVTVDVS